MRNAPPPSGGSHSADGASGIVAVGSSGVITFTPPTHALDPSDQDAAELILPPWAETVRGRRPDGREIAPTRRSTRLLFDPPLPVGSKIIARDEHGDVRVLGEVTVPLSPPSDYTPPEWTTADEQSPQ